MTKILLGKKEYLKMQEITIEYNSSILSDVDNPAIEQIPQEKEGQKGKEGKEIIELGEGKKRICMHIPDIISYMHF